MYAIACWLYQVSQIDTVRRKFKKACILNLKWSNRNHVITRISTHSSN